MPANLSKCNGDSLSENENLMNLYVIGKIRNKYEKDDMPIA